VSESSKTFNLEELFRNTKDRFPDVVWEVGGDVMKDVEMDIGGLESDCVCSCTPFFSNSLFLVQTTDGIAYW